MSILSLNYTDVRRRSVPDIIDITNNGHDRVINE